MIDELQLCIPRSNDGWFYVKMMSDPETMVGGVAEILDWESTGEILCFSTKKD